MQFSLPLLLDKGNVLHGQDMQDIDMIHPYGYLIDRRREQYYMYKVYDTERKVSGGGRTRTCDPPHDKNPVPMRTPTNPWKFWKSHSPQRYFSCQQGMFSQKKKKRICCIDKRFTWCLLLCSGLLAFWRVFLNRWYFKEGYPITRLSWILYYVEELFLDHSNFLKLVGYPKTNLITNSKP